MHWHTYTETLTVLEGAVQVTIDGREYTATAGSYVILPARAHHATVKDREVRGAKITIPVTRPMAAWKKGAIISFANLALSSGLISFRD